MIRSFRRIGLALALAGFFATATPAPAAASISGDIAAAVCPYIADAISYLESLRQSWLRDYLLRYLRSLDSKYCG